VAGDVGELFADIEWALSLLSERFDTVIWVPGDHELWTHGRETIPWRGL
jgi:3',5'-cyclic AMP phosphodiesterase CpdA